MPGGRHRPARLEVGQPHRGVGVLQRRAAPHSTKNAPEPAAAVNPVNRRGRCINPSRMYSGQHGTARPVEGTHAMSSTQEPPVVDLSLASSSVPDDLVVATAHLPVVAPVLVALGVWSDPPDPSRTETDDRLGLTLLRLRDVAAGEAAVQAAQPDRLGQLKSQLEPDGAYSPVDAILLGLRIHFGRYGNWTPEMGKNRHVGGVFALGGTKGMAVGHAVAGHAGAGGHGGIALPDGGTKGMAVGTAGAGGHGGIALPDGGTKGMAVGPPQVVDPRQVPDRPPGQAGAGVRIGILDGPLYPHSRLVGHLAAEPLLRALLDRQAHGVLSPLWLPWQGHATFVTDLVLDEAPGAAVDLRTVLGGDWGTATGWQTARKIAAFAGTGIGILNLSLGCRTADGLPPLVLTRAIERLGRDVLVVAAAGNHGNGPYRSAPIWPAALPGVIAVAAAEPEATFSPRLPWVRCTAPAVGRVGAFLSEPVEFPPGSTADGQLHSAIFGGYARWNGTSFAAATVSGAVAAAMTAGTGPLEAFEAVCDRPGGPVRRYRHPLADPDPQSGPGPVTGPGNDAVLSRPGDPGRPTPRRPT
jgi:membrane-anchored mycosin MYCP